ncbi:hypothetical protein QQG55_26755 [Brugia pahangi]
MAFTIIESIKPVKDRLERLLSEVKTMDIQTSDPTLPTNHERLEINETKDRLIDEKILQLQMCIDSIEVLNKQWIECAQKSKTKKKDKENIYKREINNEIKQITSKPPITESTTPTSYCNINLP